ncbi:MAG TPA: FxsA family protein, partial [bacterium]
LVAPGILSDVMGIILLFPPTRLALRTLIRSALGIRSVREGDGGPVPPSREVIDVHAEHVQD